MCSCMWRPEVGCWVPFSITSPLFIFFLETGPLAEPGAHRLARLSSQQMRKEGPSVPVPPSHIRPPTMPELSVVSGNLNSGPQACSADTAPTEPMMALLLEPVMHRGRVEPAPPPPFPSPGQTSVFSLVVIHPFPAETLSTHFKV